MAELDLQKKVALAPYTTFNIGGAAEYFVAVHSVEELQSALRFARENNVEVTVLGGGSNVLIDDDGIQGLVIKNEIDGVTFEENGNEVAVTAGAGVHWDDMVQETTARGLWGIENLSGIPGTVGGAVVQNINAYGVTIENYTETVNAVHVATGAERTFARSECAFAYRDSFFKKSGAGKEYVVTRVTMKLSKVATVQSAYKSASQSMSEYFSARGITTPTPEDVRGAILAVRTNIGMLEGMYNSAGSFFTNVIVSREDFHRVEAVVEERFKEKANTHTPWHWPLPDGKEKISAAFLMECTPYNKTDFKEQKFNGVVGISPVHSLSIINCGDASASDMRAFAKKIEETIHETFGVQLTSEICFLK